MEAGGGGIITLAHLPEEVLVEVLERLESITSLAVMAHVSRLFHRLVSDSSMFNKFFLMPI